MLSSPRCGARNRRGGFCRSPAVSGKRRCRMHGGAPGSGASDRK
ncbi:MAG: HGGxSTG domain-containing protein [Pseudolabrys sp.]